MNPNDAIAHLWYGQFLGQVGRNNEACDEYELARNLDPINPSVAQGLASCLAKRRQFEEAISIMRKAVEFDPNRPNIRWTLGELYERQGIYPEAIRQYQKAVELSERNPNMISLLASAYAGSGNTPEAEKYLREMTQRAGYEDPYLYALVYARMGRREDTLRYLEKAYAEHSHGMILLRKEWRFDPVRSDPRFQNLLRRLNYPEIPAPK